MVQALVDRRYIAYSKPFRVEVLKNGLVMGCDAHGQNCVRFSTWSPGQIACYSETEMATAVEALNALPETPFMAAEIPG